MSSQAVAADNRTTPQPPDNAAPSADCTPTPPQSAAPPNPTRSAAASPRLRPACASDPPQPLKPRSNLNRFGHRVHLLAPRSGAVFRVALGAVSHVARQELR